MTPEAQRIAIAEACGWKLCRDDNKTWRTPQQAGRNKELLGKEDGPWNFESAGPPDYLNDLNAMHEAEKVLPIDRQYEYGEKLRVISGNVGPKGGHFTPNGFGCYALAHLSATQRAEAFLRTLNLWKP